MMSYSTDLSDAEFEHIEEHLPTANQRGRPKIHPPREILNAIFYVLKSGCPWRLLPRELERLGGASTTGLEPGVSTVPSSV
jgi:transposase